MELWDTELAVVLLSSGRCAERAFVPGGGAVTSASSSVSPPRTQDPDPVGVPESSGSPFCVSPHPSTLLPIRPTFFLCQESPTHVGNVGL